MTSVFWPEGGLPRLLRFVSSSEMPSADTLTLYDAERNLVVINKELYNNLEPYHRYIAERCTTSLVMD